MTTPNNHHAAMPEASPSGNPTPSRPACRNIFATLRSRWRNHMPVFFRRLFWVCSLISGTALAVNTAITAGGGTPHAWWQEVYPYLLGFPAGIAFAAKFTQQYNGQPIDYDRHRQAELNGRTILDRDIDTIDDCTATTVHSGSPAGTTPPQQ